MSIADNLKMVQHKIINAAKSAARAPESVKLLPVTKSVGVEAVQALYNEGCRCFGENRIEVLNSKKDVLPSDIQWHFIGTLQRKKIRKILASSQVLHSVESLKLAEKISQVAVDMQITVEIFLEVNNGEEQKGGFLPDVLKESFASIIDLPNITVVGLMSMAPYTDDKTIVANAFKKTSDLQDELNALQLCQPLTQLSMGMSNDYELAITEGSTLVRVGSALYYN